jgi:Fe-S cluster assembly iron-binding protein IscA
MTLHISPDAHRVIAEWLARDHGRPALRISFAGGCGALGYRITTADQPMSGEEILTVEGTTFYLDYKSRADLHGARIEVGHDPDEGIIIVHDRAVVGGWC